jgi:rhodanese-related sulfurtransferase
MALRPAALRFAGIQLTLAVVVAAGLWLSYPAWRLGQISDRVRKEYPDVAHLSTGDLAKWLWSTQAVKPVILDVRSPEEYEVSHLFEAHRVNPLAELNPDDLPDDRGQSIVVYCSTGERSAAFARRLQRAAYQRVAVLDGGIVRWANEGRPLTNGRDLVTRVQTDSESAALLKRAHRSDATPAR